MSDIIKYETDHGEVRLSKNIIRRYLVSGEGNVSDQEIMMFLTLCKYQRLNPFLREAYLIKYSDKDAAQIVVGKDVHVKRASKNKQYDGMRSGVIVVKDGALAEREGSFTLPDEDIVGAWAEGKRKDWSIPRKITVSFEEFAARKKEGQLNRVWAKMPGVMIVKVAEAQCLRAMFPEDLQALYNAEEMGINDDLDEEPVRQLVDSEATKQKITILLDENLGLLGEEYVDSKRIDMDYAAQEQDEQMLVRLAEEVEHDVRNVRMREARATTKANWENIGTESKSTSALRAAQGAADADDPDAEQPSMEEQEIF